MVESGPAHERGHPSGLRALAQSASPPFRTGTYPRCRERVGSGGRQYFSEVKASRMKSRCELNCFGLGWESEAEE